MRSMFILLGTIFLVFLLNGSINLNNIEKQIIINPSQNIEQGETAFITVKSDRTLENPHFTFKDKKIKLYNKNNGEYSGILGIDALEKPGKVQLVFKDGTGFLNDQEFINIQKGHFPIQNIKISGKKGGLTATQYELNKVQNAKTALTEKAYWTEPPFNSPTKGCVISIYGLNRYYNGKPSGNYHKGVDIKAPQGEPIHSIAGGKVLIAEQFRLHGGTVAIDHGQGLTSIYIHMSKIDVKPGEIIKPNQLIGKVGATGFATGPHLHWGLYVNGTSVDPMKFWIRSVPKC